MLIAGIDDSEIESRIAECVGLWMAEGDTKTNSEITFTNNCFSLIRFFYQNLKLIIPAKNYRVYVYLPNKNHKFEKLKGIQTNVYIDKRANKPYYILRLANSILVKKWKNIIRDAIKNRKLFPFILKGFFAGEGNIKIGSHNSRQIRISQGKRNTLLEMMLNELNVTFRFSIQERAYVISGRNNWRILFLIGIANLHPIKKKLFNKTYNDFKEWHYEKNYIKYNILKLLDTPKTSAELALLFKRSQSRIQRILKKLKDENKLKCFRVRSSTYWIKKNSNTIIISNVKRNYLNNLTNPKSTKLLANNMNVCWKSSHRRLKELEKLTLVKCSNNLWKKTSTNKKVVVL